MLLRLSTILVVMVCVSACGSSSTNPSPNAPPTPTPTPTPAPSTAVVTIPVGARSLGSSAYSPNALTVSVGTTVTWMNADSIAHTSTSTATPPAFDTGSIAGGASASFKFNTAGSFPYHCTFHPGMVSTITVQ